jgi:predicted RecA/RadA family phage recombinase
MAQNDSGFKAFTVGATAITAGARVQLSSGVLVAAAAPNGSSIGVAIADGPIGGTVTVKLNNAAGTHDMLAAGAINAGAPVFPAADGKVASATTGGNLAIGIALESTTGDGQRIEVTLQPQAHS